MEEQNPYAPARTSPSSDAQSGDGDQQRLFAIEGNVRAIGLLAYGRPVATGFVLAFGAAEVSALAAAERLLVAAIYLGAGVMLRRLDRRGAFLYAVGSTFTIAEYLLATRGRAPGWLIGIFVALGLAWYLIQGAGSRVLTHRYRTVVDATRDAAPLKTARWGYLVVVFLVLSQVAGAIIKPR